MAAQAAAASKNASLPMVQQNQCPFSLLAHSVPFSIPGMNVHINDDLFGLDLQAISQPISMPWGKKWTNWMRRRTYECV